MSVAPTLFLIEPWTFGNNAPTDVCLQDLARGDENITTSFCLLLASSWSYQSQVSWKRGLQEHSRMHCSAK